jgi:hypothetical protein
MRDIKQLKKKAKQKREAKKPPTITGGAAQIDLALDAAAEAGDFSATLPGRIPPGIAQQYIDEGFIITETLTGSTIYFQIEEGEDLG